jgi:drug/metabolite transporter (DMT)-like permease
VTGIELGERTATARRRTGVTPGVWAALVVVYLVWGSTYLAIRVAIETLPPMLMAATRFLIAGAILAAIGRRSGERPGREQWWAAAVVGTLLFLGGNGGVVWAEQRVSSGVAALIVATVPLWMALIGWVALGERARPLAVAGLVLGFAGTALLVRPSGEGSVDLVGAGALVGASVAWAVGSLYARRAPLPRAPALSAGMQLLAGGAALGLAGILGGELSRVHAAGVSRSSLLAFAYLVVFGTLVAFPCYAWLLRSAPTTLVSTYAYVNPVVAVALGWGLADEPVTPLTLLAGGIVLASVAMIVSARRTPEPGEPAAGAPPVEEASAPAAPPTRATEASRRAGSARSPRR